MANKKSKVLMWGLLGLLVVGLGGFGATSFSGSVQEVGHVEDKPIRLTAYANGVQNQMSQMSQQFGQTIGFQQAEMFGIPNAVLSGLVTDRALDVEAETLGLSVGDDTVGRSIMQIPAFQGPNGDFSRDSYEFALQNAGLTDSEFEADLRDESARSLLQTAVISATRMPPAYLDTLVSYSAETRQITYARVSYAQLQDEVAEPDDAALEEFYNANIDTYTAPEKKRITYALLSPDMVIDQVEISDEAIRDQYEARIDEFEQPERRLVERLVYPSEEAAQTAMDRLTAGEVDFDTLVTDRGLKLSDVDLGDVAVEDLGSAGEAVFDAASGDVVGPLASDFGPALFRVNGVLGETSTDYEEAAALIRDELAADAARRLVTQSTEPADDLLAGGATLEELAEEEGMALETIDWAPGMSDGIAAYADFAEAAEALTEEDYPAILSLDDGGIFAMRLDEVVPAAPIPFDEARSQVAKDWIADARRKAFRDRAEELMAEMDAGASFTDLGLTPMTDESVTRNGQVLSTPEGFNDLVFAMEEGSRRVTEGFDAALIVQLDTVTPPAEDDPNLESMRSALGQQISSSLANDLYQIYAQDIRNGVSVYINQEALNAVNAQFP
ncbi:SurA N-terminal domain-containing protein [Pseudooceanicola sp. HF7]|uniref:SurA N-terminal domain-containing protein n=1 Tax=Pseudooceanicola sp. HF7 TaxID=2721560 RepID=UPI001430B3C1|nr:SurA N-terminal domain-containing protein [Pseudooceanicola sp. HF7]NIZ10307.1 peptidylprolyl isomerase [Pseudooceanicola sp. HF7]